jgi:hypothetical protein
VSGLLPKFAYNAHMVLYTCTPFAYKQILYNKTVIMEHTEVQQDNNGVKNKQYQMIMRW